MHIVNFPFGLKQNGYNNITNSLGNSTAQKFGYNSKELNEELGLEWHDFGARNYDAALGRWMNLDPLAEEMYTQSPYNYALNNPVLMLDPDGRKPYPGPFTGRAYRQNNGVIITVARETYQQRYAIGVYTQVAYTFGGWAGFYGGIAESTFTQASPQNIVQPVVEKAAEHFFDYMEKGYYQVGVDGMGNSILDDFTYRNGVKTPIGKYDIAHYRGVSNVFLKGSLKVAGYVGLVGAVLDTGRRGNEYLGDVTYKFADKMIAKGNINIRNPGLFNVHDESATEESVESSLNVIYTGISIVLAGHGFDVSTEKGQDAANKFLHDKENRRLISHFINYLWKSHQNSETQD